MCVAFLPSPTSLLGEYGNHQLAVVIYAASLTVARLMLTAVWWYALSGRLMDDELEDGMIRTYRIPTEFGGSPYRSFRDLDGRLQPPQGFSEPRRLRERRRDDAPRQRARVEHAHHPFGERERDERR